MKFLEIKYEQIMNDTRGKKMTVFFYNSLRYFHACIFFIIKVSMKKCNERVAEHGCQNKEKTKEDQTEIQHAAYVEAKVSVIDVHSVCDMADRF